MAGSTIGERLAAAWRRAAEDAADLGAPKMRPVAVGWGTVELDRATSELAAALGLGGHDVFRAAPRSVALGASCRVVSGVLPGGGSLIVLEPDTEGRLAGSLARRGEGPAVAWLAVDTPEEALAAVRAAGFAALSEREGPLGPERLIAGGATSAPGQHRLLVVHAAGTIRS